MPSARTAPLEIGTPPAASPIAAPASRGRRRATVQPPRCSRAANQAVAAEWQRSYWARCPPAAPACRDFRGAAARRRLTIGVDVGQRRLDLGLDRFLIVRAARLGLRGLARLSLHSLARLASASRPIDLGQPLFRAWRLLRGGGAAVLVLAFLRTGAAPDPVASAGVCVARRSGTSTAAGVTTDWVGCGIAADWLAGMVAGALLATGCSLGAPTHCRPGRRLGLRRQKATEVGHEIAARGGRDRGANDL